ARAPTGSSGSCPSSPRSRGSKSCLRRRTAGGRCRASGSRTARAPRTCASRRSATPTPPSRRTACSRGSSATAACPWPAASRSACPRRWRQGPADVELGYHFCYGDVQHRHFTEPRDAARLVEIANALAASLGRPLTWVHLPVPRDRADDAYYAPLAGLRLRPETELYLG